MLISLLSPWSIMSDMRIALVASLLIGCQSAPSPSTAAVASSGEAVVPDSATVAGVLTLTHSAGAFARAPQFRLDSTPAVVYAGGEQVDFDLTNVRRPLLFPDGRLLAAISLGTGRLLLFNADGKPARVLAPSGEGPSDVRSPLDPVAFAGDTALVIDGNLHRLIWVTADGGIVRTEPLKHTVQPLCFRNLAALPGSRLLAPKGCQGELVIDRLNRPAVEVVAMDIDFGNVDTVATLPGSEMVPFESRFRGVKHVDAVALRLGQSARVAPWGSGFVSATGEGGYLLERRALDGRIVARIVVKEPRRAVTRTMREDVIRRDLERVSGPRSEGLVDPGETRRQARETPFADSLPPYASLFAAPDDVLWVTDYTTTTDSSWSATAFRFDGRIVRRLTAHMKDAAPISFGRDRVLVRLIDEDGVVRFAVYTMAQHEE
jgi:hypothetical protein